MARQPVAANLLMMVFLVGGLLMYGRITKEYLPDTADDTVTVKVAYRGASPEEVEDGVILAIEEAVKGLSGVGEVRSTANEGSGRVTVEMVSGGDLQQLAQDMKSRIDAIRSFPVDAEEPTVAIDSRRREVLQLVIYADAQRTAMHELAQTVRDMLLQTGKITQIDIIGLPAQHINIDTDPDTLRRYGLTFPDLATIVRGLSTDTAAGNIKGQSGDHLIRIQDQREYAGEFEKIPVMTTQSGAIVRLEEIASVQEGFAESDQTSTYNGKPAVLLEVFRVGDETPVVVADAVTDHLDQIKSVLPSGVGIDILNSRAERYRGRVNLLLKNGATGLILVLLGLGIFLQARLAFWVMMGIPISFMGALLLMPAFAASINMVSLFAFIIALGIVVDDAIVVGENIYFHRERGSTWTKAAIDGAREVAKPVIFSILTNIIAFMPLMFIPGPRGKLFWMIPAVVISAFAVSLIESLFVLPAHLAHAGKGGVILPAAVESKRMVFVTKFNSFIKDQYTPFLARIMTHRKIVPAVALAILIAMFGYIKSGRLGFVSFPPIESDFAYFYAEYPVGTPASLSRELSEKLVESAKAIWEREGLEQLVKGIYARVGQGGGHTIEVRTYLADPDIRDDLMSTTEFVNQWRKETGPISGTKIVRFQSNRGGPGSGNAISLQLNHRNVEILQEAAATVAKKLEDFPMVSDISDGTQDGKPQFDIRLNQTGRALGMTSSDLGRQIRGQIYGIESNRQLRNGNEITVLVRGNEGTRYSDAAFENMIVRTPGKQYVPLSSIASINSGKSFTSIERRDGARIVNVTADVRPLQRTNEIVTALNSQILPEVKRSFPGLSHNYSGRQKRDQQSLGGLGRLLPLALFCIFALLAIPFSSYVLAGLIMSTIPFGLVGAALGHILMGYSLSIPGILGIVALAGVLINDALVLIEFAEQKRRSGLDALEAVQQAAVQRFRPIYLTTFTTFAGLMPIMLETSRQAKFLIPMAISLGFGLLFATIVVLTLIPAFYVLAADRGLLPDVEEDMD